MPAPPAITLTEAALKNLKRLRDEVGDETLLLRMGVKSGGCSGGSPRFKRQEVRQRALVRQALIRRAGCFAMGCTIVLVQINKLHPIMEFFGC